MTDTLSTKEHTEAHGDKIGGYRKLNDTEIAQINELKRLGNALDHELAVIARDAEADPRWLDLARTDLQKGIMFAVRAVAKPQGF